MNSARQKILSPAAFGIHYKIDKELRDFVEDAFKHSTFYFHEYILDTPITFNQDLKDILKENVRAVAPYLARAVHHSGLVPAVNENVVDALKTETDPAKISRMLYSVPATPQNLKHYGDFESIGFKISHSLVLQKLLAVWLDPPKDLDDLKKEPDWRNLFSEIIEVVPAKDQYGVVSTIAILNKETFSEDNYLKVALATDKSNEEAQALLREYELVLRPFFRNLGKDADSDEVIAVCATISSDALCWGECIVLLAVAPGDAANTFNNRALKVLRERLVTNVQRIILPMMTLFENYLCETKIKGQLKIIKSELGRSGDFVAASSSLAKDVDISWLQKNQQALGKLGLGYELLSEDVPFGPDEGHSKQLFFLLLHACVKSTNAWPLKLNELERALIRLWAARYAVLFAPLLKPTTTVGLTDPTSEVRMLVLAKLEESLVFEKYLITSPSMLQQIMKVLKLRHGEPGQAIDKVKTALVVGGPGSGKDSMAQLIRLFSPGYRFGMLVTLNMATFRPKEAAVPLLLGLDIYTSQTSQPEYAIAGTLKRAWQDNREKNAAAPLRIAGDEPEENGVGLTFIFDELNSLDIDTQGALLRFLENSELVALGDFKKPSQKVGALIIGVMNEDPYTITKVRTLDRVLRDKEIFGGMLGEFLYESFRNQRRLRDDLYFRFIRGGEIVIPELRERREDLPILFYFTVEKELKGLMPAGVDENWDIELSTYEALMDQNLLWEGNVREVQTIARRIVELANDAYEADLHTGRRSRYLLRGVHARAAIAEHRQGVKPSPYGK